MKPDSRNKSTTKKEKKVNVFVGTAMSAVATAKDYSGKVSDMRWQVFSILLILGVIPR